MGGRVHEGAPNADAVFGAVLRDAGECGVSLAGGIVFVEVRYQTDYLVSNIIE